jgi:hypothetical protein
VKNSLVASTFRWKTFRWKAFRWKTFRWKTFRWKTTADADLPAKAGSHVRLIHRLKPEAT